MTTNELLKTLTSRSYQTEGNQKAHKAAIKAVKDFQNIIGNIALSADNVAWLLVEAGYHGSKK